MAGIAPGTPLRWAIALANLDPIEGSEQAGRRRVLVVSYEPFHRSGLITVCPISARKPRRPNEVRIPAGEGGQTKDAVVLIHQLRTVSATRVFAWEVQPGRGVAYLTDPSTRADIRASLAVHLGLDIPPAADGAGR